MRELCHNLFLGSMADYELLKNDDHIVFVQACAFPYYKDNILNNEGDNLHVFTNNNKCLSLNMIDDFKCDYERYLALFNITKQYIDDNIKDNRVLIHCNMGQTRSATFALLYLKTINYFKDISFNEAERQFLIMYPSYSYGMGIREFALKIWDEL